MEVKKDKEHKKPGSVHDGHRERMRERVSKTGFDGLKDHELLEMLLYYSIPRKDTNELAHEIIDHFGSFANVLEANKEELVKIKGVSEYTATLIKMMLPISSRYTSERNSNIKLRNSDASGKYLVKYYKGCNKEKVVLLCLDSNNRVLSVNDVCDGDATNVAVNLRRIVEIVMKSDEIKGAIIAHNHPNGIAIPSLDDLNATKEIKRSLGVLGVTLIDHIIVGDSEYTSMAVSPSYGVVFK